MIAWMFPGQGSQTAGMAAGIAACNELFENASPIVGVDLERLCTTDPDPTWSPEVLQCALYTTCVGVARGMQTRGLEPDAVVGHSLGEFAALVAAKGLSFEDGLRVVAVRGKAMAAAGQRHPGGMAAVIGLDAEVIEEICSKAGDVWVANLNSPKQTVISGKDRPLAQAAEQCRHAGASRVIRINVPIAGHCPLMEPAAEAVQKVLADVSLSETRCPIYCNADGRPHTEAGEIRDLIVKAITSRVRFVDAVRAMEQDGVSVFVETGPGKVLRGLVRQTLKGAELDAVANDEQADELARQKPPEGSGEKKSPRPSASPAFSTATGGSS
ncbi:MAG: ACP S-malonyltransferase [Actinomycetota bacterium]|nr:ACP S-malonyltransferase [Actinomycetota bacterium]